MYPMACNGCNHTVCNHCQPNSEYLILAITEPDEKLICITTAKCGIRVVGKGSWKEREVGKSEVGKFR